MVDEIVETTKFDVQMVGFVSLCLYRKKLNDRKVELVPQDCF